MNFDVEGQMSQRRISRPCPASGIRRRTRLRDEIRSYFKMSSVGL